MKVWITSFLVLFAGIELYQWISHFTLPLPTFILGGALLAIASNYGKVSNWFFQDSDAEPPVIDSASSQTSQHLNSSQSPVFQQPRSISFTINHSRESKRAN